jgi:uncharacterized protein YbbC (DUF1343 family)
MRRAPRLFPIFLIPFFLITCSSQSAEKGPQRNAERKKDSAAFEAAPIKVGAERTASYLSKLEGKKVAVVANPTSKVGDVHLVDTLLARGVELERILSPEHGFRGDAEAGEKVKDGKDPRTGLPVVSL